MSTLHITQLNLSFTSLVTDKLRMEASKIMRRNKYGHAKRIKC